MNQSAFITGITGFAGSFLAEKLLENGYKVFGVARDISKVANISHILPSLELFFADLLDSNSIKAVFSKVKPDVIFHLAAFAPTGESFRDPAGVIHNNVISQVNLLEAIRQNNLVKAKILLVSSAEVYGGISPDDLPINEQTKLRPVSPYSVSKIAQEFLGLQYHLTYGLNIFVARPFNHIGPRQATNFVVSSFAKQISEIEKGKKEPVLRVGNLETKRDFTDVRDMVLAYYLLIKKGKPGEIYNIGSGFSRKISEILDMLLSFSKVKIKVEADKFLFRPVDVEEVVCDNSKIVNLINWKPTVAIEKSLKDTLDYWRNIN